MRTTALKLSSEAEKANQTPKSPPLSGTFRNITHPFAPRRQGCPRAAVRLAGVRPAASVQSEPGSHSSVQSLFLPFLAQSLQTVRAHILLSGMFLRSFLY